MDLQLTGALDIQSIITESGEPAAISQIILALPFGDIALILFAIVAIVFLVTTYDSASYTLASVTTQKLQEGQDPARSNRLFWACALGIVPVALMSIDGGLKVILSTTIVVSLPLLLIGGLMTYSLMKMLKSDHG
jgi:BCCT family betaine/carnitine transporter